MENFKVICAWCGVFIRGNSEASKISHGICRTCLAKQMEEIQKEKDEPLSNPFTMTLCPCRDYVDCEICQQCDSCCDCDDIDTLGYHQEYH